MSTDATNNTNELFNRAVNGNRILYVDPNNAIGTINGVPLTPDYSDLCISFDLRVETVPRTGYVSGEKSNVVNADKGQVETYHFFWTSYEANKTGEDNVVSFMKGEQYGGNSYLTTYYTDINLDDFGREEVVEGLGVENVTVSFENYYVPTIKMRFIDVRGASLFGRQEVTHVDEKITKDSIWGCFFTFPYPKFRLQIKGFYGHPVTYQLACTDFRANFNSKTGNFEIDVTFLGYDYGIMADIPTAYLIAAPYSKYVGEDYWNQHLFSKDWELSDGKHPERLFEIMKNIKSAIRYAEKDEKSNTVSDGNDGSEDANVIQKEAAFGELKYAYAELESLPISYSGTASNKEAQHTLYRFYVKGEDEYYLFDAHNEAFWIKVRDAANNFYEKLETFVTNFPEEENTLDKKFLPFGRAITKDEPIGTAPKREGKELNENQSYLSQSKQEKGNWVSYNENGGGAVKRYKLTTADADIVVGTNFTEDKPVVIQAKDIYTKGTNQKIVKYVDGQFMEIVPQNWLGIQLGNKNGYQIIPMGKTAQIFQSISDRMDSYMLEKSAKYELEQEETDDSTRSRLSIYAAAGLLPTIGNVFKTIMCHLETFMAMMYHCKDNIDRQITAGDRTPQKLGISDFFFTDANGSDISVSGVPPWVGVSVAERKGETGSAIYDSVNTIGWVGSFEGEVQWEEAKLIEGLSMAALHVLKEKEAVSPFSYSSTAIVPCLPTDTFSEIFPSAATNNPYALGEYLGIRAAALFGVAGIEETDAAAFGTADALNLFGKLNSKEALKSLTVNNDYFKKAVKEAPTKPNIKDRQGYNERIYTILPGCEKTQAQILTPDGNNYRYTYSEVVHGRSGKGKYSSLYPMVPVVTGGVQSIFQNDKNLAEGETFVYNSPGGDYMDISAYYLQDGDGKVGRIYHKGTTATFIQENPELVAQNGGSAKTFQNEAMFSILNGGTQASYDFKDTLQRLEQQTLKVGTYEDTDTSWRTAFRKYWNIGFEKRYFNTDVDLEEYRWKVYDGGLTNYTGTTSTPFTCIFNSPFYYAQNAKYGTTQPTKEFYEAAEGAKCLLFLSTAGYDISSVIDAFKYIKRSAIVQEIPYGAVLLLGGLLWREELNQECILYPSNIYSPLQYKSQDGATTYTTFSKTNFGTLKKYWLLVKPNTGTYAYVNANEYETCVLDRKDKGLSTIFDINVRNRLIAEFKYFLSNKWEDIRKLHEWTKETKKDETNNNGNNFYNYSSYVDELKSYAKNKSELAKKLQNNYNSVKSDTNIAELDKNVYITRGTRSNQGDDSNVLITFSKSCWDTYTDAFCSKAIEIANSVEKLDDDMPNGKPSKDVDLKLAMYMYLKRLWDRWFMTSSKEQFEVQNYMQNFVFMDSLYRNIGDLLHINCEKLYDKLANVNGKSMLFQLLSSITTDHNCHFFAFPDYFGFGDDNNEQKNTKLNYLSPEEKIQDMFKPIPFSRKTPMETSNKYVVVLIYNQNENLSDVNGYKYDGFDIFSHDGSPNVLPATFTTPAVDTELLDAPSETRRMRRYGYNIPSFGVTFGRMDNHLFKNVNINMSNPIATEQTINALSIIAEKGGGSDKVVCFYGQDLYPVYNGYSYTCTVEMMGNAQIMPLMYFQLLNIPMFRGTYMIYSVTHTMRPGDMTTTFQGMKLSRNALPFAKGWYTNGPLFVTDDGTLTTLPWEDVCGESGNIDFKWNKEEAAMKISGNRGITRSKKGDPETLCKSWQTNITVRVHTDTFKDGVQQETTVSLEVNKFIADEIKQIFEEIFETKVGGKYFAIKSVYCYDYRLVNNPKYPNTQKLSNHSYGIAIDINAKLNPFNKNAGGVDDWKTMRTENHPVVQIFYKHRPWGWGGRYGDWMHFSYFNGG